VNQHHIQNVWFCNHCHTTNTATDAAMDIKRFTSRNIKICEDGRLAIDTNLFGRQFTLYGENQEELLLIANEYARCLIASHNRKMQEIDNFFVSDRSLSKLHLTFSSDKTP